MNVLARSAVTMTSIMLALSSASVVSRAQTNTPKANKLEFEVMVAPRIASKRYGPSSMVQLKDGRILIAYDDFPIMGEDAGFSSAFVAGRFSQDNGRSWGRPFVPQEITSELGRMGPASLL